MSKLAQQIDEFLKSTGILVEDFNKQNVRVKADRLDKVLNGQIIPRLGLHAALIGTCLMVSTQSHPISYLFAFIAAALAGWYFVSGNLQSEGQSGLPGASAVLVTAAAAAATTDQWAS